MLFKTQVQYSAKLLQFSIFFYGAIILQFLILVTLVVYDTLFAVLLWFQSRSSTFLGASSCFVLQLSDIPVMRQTDMSDETTPFVCVKIIHLDPVDCRAS